MKVYEDAATAYIKNLEELCSPLKVLEVVVVADDDDFKNLEQSITDLLLLLTKR